MRRVNNGEIDARRLKQLYHNLDRDVHSICIKAEKCCRPEWAGKLDWSPDLVKAIKTLNYWRARLRVEGETPEIQHKGQEVGIVYVKLDMDIIHQKILDSKRQLTEVQKNA